MFFTCMILCFMFFSCGFYTSALEERVLKIWRHSIIITWSMCDWYQHKALLLKLCTGGASTLSRNHIIIYILLQLYKQNGSIYNELLHMISEDSYESIKCFVYPLVKKKSPTHRFYRDFTVIFVNWKTNFQSCRDILLFAFFCLFSIHCLIFNCTHVSLGILKSQWYL